MVSTKKPTAAPTVRPKPPPKFPYPTVAFDTCDLYIDCSKDDKDFKVELGARDVSIQANPALVKRARKFEVNIGSKQMIIKALDYPVSSDLYTKGNGKELTVHTLDLKNTRIGTTAVVDRQRIPTTYSNYPTEHIIEVSVGSYSSERRLTYLAKLQTVGMFIEDAVNRNPNLASFFLNKWNKELSPAMINKRRNKPQIKFGKGRKNINALVFEALGSNLNRKDFLLCDKEINAYKERLWRGVNPMESGEPTTKFERLVGKANLGKLPSNRYLSGIRMVSV